METLTLAHLVVTLLMTGVVLFVAVVHYPLFGMVGKAEFPAYSAAHQTRTGFVVVPLMSAELVLAVLLAFDETLPRTLTFTGLALVVAAWATTFFFNVPLHAALLRGLTPALVKKQVAWNWVRTFCWCARSAVAIAVVAQRSPPAH
ncbi:MAG: hypothetical protein SGI72_12135 [Planctomycetota bacterium]|nr:hypothetical protein [Planctomycetota bacterium]